jgi:hypothetical protein
VIVFEIFRRNGDWTFYVAVKIGGRFKKMMDWDLFHLKRPMSYMSVLGLHSCLAGCEERWGPGGREVDG